MKVPVGIFGVLVFATALCGQSRESVAACEKLSSLKLPNTTITLTKAVAAGEFTLLANGPGSSAQEVSKLPAFCRVAATLKPSTDSDIHVEVWLPEASGWNGKFEAVGNGGWAGSISYPAMGDALKLGYATTSTDTGHSTPGGSFALGHPEKVIDYAYRSEHEMTEKAKAIISAYYGRGPKYSYWNGCSSGGKQALKEAQRFPEDYDGIIAGSPASHWTGRASQSLWVHQAVHKDDYSYLPPGKYALIHNAVLEACDAQDGVIDGVLEDPTACKFDPKMIECKSGDGANCLSAAQVEAVRKIYSPATNSKTKEIIFPGHERGSELGWTTMAGPKPFATGVDHFRYVVFKDPSWDPSKFDFDRDSALAEKIDNGTINAIDPNLKAFFARGGKMIQYHGWSDPQISPGSSVRYFKSVLSQAGDSAKVAESYRLFMVPGMAHCRGGEGTSTFDMMSALEQWVEKGKAPDQILASREKGGKIDRTRPLCPYPQVAKYKGSGSTDEAANFVCKAP